MVSGYASPSPSSSPPTPRSPLPVSVGPAHHHYHFSSSPSPSPPFSPPSSPHADILYPTASFSLDHQLQPHHKLHSTCFSCLLDLLKWFFQRCCTIFSTRKRCHQLTHLNDCCKTIECIREKAKPDRLAL